jgi:hypothetical protein
MNQQISTYLGEPPPLLPSSSTESTFQLTNSRTESIFQTPDRTKYLTIRTIEYMATEVEYTEEFEQWYLTLDEAEQDSIDFVVELLEDRGVNLSSRYSSDIKGSRHGNMRELRIQHKGEPYRILYCFDPRRIAVLLLGGNKKGNDRWYEENVPKADKLYNELLKELKDEGLI